MKATRKQSGFKIVLELSEAEARQLSGLLYSVSCDPGAVRLSGLIPTGMAGQFSTMPEEGFDRGLFDILVDALPAIGEES